VACEMKPTGEETILGIREELSNAGIEDIVLTGSTEENFATSMTALAITVIGVAREGELKFGRAADGDKFILFGLPAVGAEVDLANAGLYKEIASLLKLSEVREIVPVGSKGIAYEAKTLAGINGMEFMPLETGVDLEKSAGPVTCLLILCAESAAGQVCGIYPEARLIGEIRAKSST